MSSITIATNDPDFAEFISKNARKFCFGDSDPNPFRSPNATPSAKPQLNDDAEEERDDLHFNCCALAEVGGLVRRARTELAQKDVRAAMRTLGRAQDVCDTEAK